jgi:hypothetical protein
MRLLGGIGYSGTAVKVPGAAGFEFRAEFEEFWIGFHASCGFYAGATNTAPTVQLRFLDEESVFATGFAGTNHFVAGLLAESFHIFHGTWVSCDNFQNFARSQTVDGFLGAEDWQWAVQAACIQFLFKIRHVSSPDLRLKGSDPKI